MWFYKFAVFVLSPLVKFIFPFKITYEAPIPETGAIILSGKHISLMDAILAAVSFKRPVNFMAKAELFKFKPFGWLLKSLGAFPVKRGTGDLGALKTSLKVLRDGNVLGIMPEGTRVSRLENLVLKTGAMNLAYKTKATVVPYGIYSQDYHIKAFRRIYINFGRPKTFDEIGFTDGSKEDLERVTNGFLKSELIRLSQPDTHKRLKQ
ncbi:MAG: lysophospholipid acyltransferase family protein [Bacillota bacterium]|nr:lysophospholipid acyltransferase family protein [Bacillota bacterium]